MKISFILLVAIVLGLNSCYEDKGNCNYKYLVAIEIGKFSDAGRIDKTLGDTLRISPEFTYSAADTVMNLKYTWTFIDKVISKERNLEYILDTIAMGKLVLKVEDVDHEVYFIQDCNLSVGYKYQTGGFLVLSEKDGNSSLSFLKDGKTHYDSFGNLDSIEFDVVKDVYQLENNDVLKGKPVKVHEHFCKDGATKGQTLVLLENSLVDVNSLTFQKEVTGDQIFVGGWPAGLKPADAFFMEWTDLLTDEKGHLYSRIKSTNKLFHSEYFLPEPMTFEKEVMSKIEIVLAKFANPQFCLLYDGAHNRYLTVLDVVDLDDGINEAGMVQALDVSMTSGGYPEGFVPLEDLGEYKPVYTGYVSGDQGGRDITYFVLLEKDGRYYHQEFTVTRNVSSFIISKMSMREIPSMADIPDDKSVVYALPYDHFGWYVFVSKGNQLYMYDRESPENGVKLFYTFDGEVTCMDSEFYWSKCLGVGLSNGRVAVLKMQGAKNAQTDGEKLFWESPLNENLGRVKSIRYKVQSGNGWSPS